MAKAAIKPLLERAAKLDAAAALALVVEAWGHKRAPALADAVAHLGAQAKAPPLSKATQKAWLAVAASKQATDLDRLLASLWDTTAAHVRGRLAALAAWPADPRTAAAIAAYVGGPSHDRISPLWRAVYVDALDALARLADPRSAATIAFVAKPPAKRDKLSKERQLHLAARSRLGRAAQDRLVAVHARLAELPVPVLSAPEKTACARLVKPVAKRSTADGESLLAAIQAHPDDDAPRLIYADWLQERDDPRGEFIVLQCHRQHGTAPTRRESQLERVHQREWLGALDPVICKGGVRFERGFLAACTYQNVGADAFIGHSEWSTVVEIELAVKTFSHEVKPLLLHPVMRALRSVRQLRNDDLLAVVGSKRALPFESLHVRDVRANLGEERAFLAGKSLPQLRRLDLADAYTVDVDALVGLIESPLGRRLVELAVVMPKPEHAAAVRAVKALRGIALTSLVLCEPRAKRHTYELAAKAKR